ncbi:MAG: hypothetical protein ACRD96_16500, partial [Bryobacteraceae bacterium]
MTPRGFLVLLAGLAAAETHSFVVEDAAEVVADLDLSGPEWPPATATLDGGSKMHVPLYAGGERHTYSVFLGRVSAGAHRLEIGARVHGVRIRQFRRGDALYDVIARAPVLFARANTLDRFSDVPLLAYCERLTENGRPLLQYTVVFSNEDGGTSTRALMARWGRTTDIEYLYRVFLDDGSATMQTRDHKDVPFRGRRFGEHPLLAPVTDNNMVSDEGETAIRYQLAPRLVDLAARSREAVMDEEPVTYRAMARELEREGKIRPFGTVDGEKISDPRNYLYLEAKVSNRNSAVAFLAQQAATWRTSHLGRAGYAITRDGWIRTTIELPPGAGPSGIAVACLVAEQKPPAVAGVCRVEAVTKAFFLGEDYRPGRSIWSL